VDIGRELLAEISGPGPGEDIEDIIQIRQAVKTCHEGARMAGYVPS